MSLTCPGLCSAGLRRKEQYILEWERERKGERKIYTYMVTRDSGPTITGFCHVPWTCITNKTPYCNNQNKLQIPVFELFSKFKFLLQIFGLERVRQQNQTIWPSFQQNLSEIPRFEVPRSSIFWNSLSIAVFGVEFVEHYSSWRPPPAPRIPSHISQKPAIL